MSRSRRKVTVQVTVVCPIDATEIESAKAVFLANPGWKNAYDNAPEGAKKRLEVAFWFSQIGIKQAASDTGVLENYRAWRNVIESDMTVADIEYMIRISDKPVAKEHFKKLLRNLSSHPQCPDSYGER